MCTQFFVSIQSLFFSLVFGVAHGGTQMIRGECRAGEFQCLRSKECISVSFLCDFNQDCVDASDEEFCGTSNICKKPW